MFFWGGGSRLTNAESPDGALGPAVTVRSASHHRKEPPKVGTGRLFDHLRISLAIEIGQIRIPLLEKLRWKRVWVLSCVRGEDP